MKNYQMLVNIFDVSSKKFWYQFWLASNTAYPKIYEMTSRALWGRFNSLDGYWFLSINFSIYLYKIKHWVHCFNQIKNWSIRIEFMAWKVVKWRLWFLGTLTGGAPRSTNTSWITFFSYFFDFFILSSFFSGFQVHISCFRARNLI